MIARRSDSILRSQSLLLPVLLALGICSCSVGSTHSSEEVAKRLENSPVYQCEHGTGGVVIACSNLDCGAMVNVSAAVCKTLGQRLLRQSAELIKFKTGRNSGKGTLKVVEQNFAGNTIICTFSQEPPENKIEVEWARYQQMSCVHNVAR